MIKFKKMHGNGNDFIIVENLTNIYSLPKSKIIKMGDRKKGLGFDQLITINPPKNSKHDFYVKFFNSDGGESGACGNGTRCVADLISKENGKKNIILTTLSGNLKSEILGNNLVTTEIGEAKTKWNEIPLSNEMDTKNLNIKIRYLTLTKK